jgi:hypothetical protein
MASGTRRRRISGHELVEQLNEVVAQLIKENRKLKRQVDKLSARGTKAASGTVDRSLRTIQRRVQKALLSGPVRRRRRKGAGAAPAAKKVTRRRRTPKASG